MGVGDSSPALTGGSSHCPSARRPGGAESRPHEPAAIRYRTVSPPEGRRHRADNAGAEWRGWFSILLATSILDGFASQRWTVEEDFAVPLDASMGRAGVLTEPTSVVAKAWVEIEKIGRRSWFEPERVLVTSITCSRRRSAGSGPVVAGPAGDA